MILKNTQFNGNFLKFHFIARVDTNFLLYAPHFDIHKRKYLRKNITNNNHKLRSSLKDNSAKCHRANFSSPFPP